MELPPSPLPFYVGGAVTDRQGFRYSTPLLRVDPAGVGLLQPQAKLAYDGCGVWGGFEPAGVEHL